MPDVRAFMGSGYFNGKIYLVGGYTTGNVIRRSARYGSTTQWPTPLTPAAQACRSPGRTGLWHYQRAHLHSRWTRPQ